MKAAIQPGYETLFERIYTYKLLSFTINPQTVQDRLTELKRSIDATFPTGCPEGLSNLMGLAEQSISSEVRSQLAHMIGEMRELEPLERRLVTADSMGITLADLAGFYQAFELNLSKDILPDHFSVEAEFMAHLLLREAYAVATGNIEMMDVVVGAQKKFLRDHLGKSLNYFVTYQRKLPVINDVAKLGAAFLRSELELYGVSAPHEPMGVSNSVEDPSCPLV